MMSPFNLFSSSSLFTAIIAAAAAAIDFIVSFAAAAENAGDKFTVATYPSPQTLRTPGFDHWRCHIDQPGLVCDPDALMSQKERNVLQAMSNNFTEATQYTGSEGQRLFVQCPGYLLTTASQFPSYSMSGIRVGIALVRHQLEQSVEEEETLYNRTKPSPGEYSEQELRDHLRHSSSSTYTDELFDRAWARLKRLESREKKAVDNKPAAQLAKKWGLVKNVVHGCDLAMLILASADPLQIEIYSNPAVPIFAEETKAIVDNEMTSLAATGNVSSTTLHSIIRKMRELIVQRQRLSLGYQQEQIPSASTTAPPTSVQPSTTTSTKVTASPVIVKTPEIPIIKLDCSVEQKFTLLACVLFSLVSLCLALFSLKKNNQMRKELSLLKAGSVKMSALNAVYQNEP